MIETLILVGLIGLLGWLVRRLWFDGVYGSNKKWEKLDTWLIGCTLVTWILVLVIGSCGD